MSFDSQPVKPDNLSGQAFDIQGFRDLLTNLKESKQQKENKAKPTYEPEE